VNQRWLAVCSPHLTVQKSIKRLKELEAMASVEGGYAGRPKKEVIRWSASAAPGPEPTGIKDMPGLPDVLFVIDSNKESIAVKEARGWASRWSRSSIPTATRTKWDYVIPGNDDALRAIRLFRQQDSRTRWWKAARLATEQDFHGRQDCSGRTPGGRRHVEYTEYVDRKYAREDHGGEPEHGGMSRFRFHRARVPLPRTAEPVGEAR